MWVCARQTSLCQRLWLWGAAISAHFSFAVGQSSPTWTPLTKELRYAFNTIAPAAQSRFFGCARDLKNISSSWLSNYLRDDHLVNATYGLPGGSDVNMAWSWHEIREDPVVPEPKEWVLGPESSYIPIIGWRGGRVSELLAYYVGSLLIDFLGLPFVYIRDATNLPEDPVNFTRQLCSDGENSALIDVEISSSWYTPFYLTEVLKKELSCLKFQGTLSMSVFGGLYAYYGAKAVEGLEWFSHLWNLTAFERLPLEAEHKSKSVNNFCHEFDYLHPGWTHYFLGHGCTFVPPHCCSPVPDGFTENEPVPGFVAKHVETCLDSAMNCSQIFHPRPGYLIGELEAMIMTYKLPYYIQYIGYFEMGNLMTKYGDRNFLAFLSTPSPFYDLNGVQSVSDLEAASFKRVQFPTDINMCENLFLPARPSTPHRCDVTFKPLQKWTSAWFSDTYPAGGLVIDRFNLDQQAVQSILDLDMKFPAPDVTWKWDQFYASGVCQAFRNNENASRTNIIRNCSRADQPVHRHSCVCHRGLAPTITDRITDCSSDQCREARCSRCPKDHYCPGLWSAARKACGLPNSTTGAGRRRRGMGPTTAKDCQCLPGYGWPASGDLDSATCIPCEPGLYKAEHRHGYCKDPCEGGSWSAESSISHLNCTCSPGYFRENTEPVNCLNCEDIIGADCPGGMGPPSAKPGYMSIIALNGTQFLPEFYQCWLDPEVGVCLGNNQCRKGHTGWLCNQCINGWAKPFFAHKCEECSGWADWLFVFLVVGVFTVIAVFYASIMVENAVDHNHVVSVLLNIVFHTGFVIQLGSKFDHKFTFGAYAPAEVGHMVHRANACILKSFQIVEPTHIALSICAIGPLWALVSLSWLWIIYNCQLILRLHRIQEYQRQANAAAELIQVVDQMIELAVVDKDAGRKRMHNIRNELKCFIGDLVYKSRINYIWRTILFPEELKRRDRLPYFHLFRKDSATVYNIWCLWLHVLMGPKIFAVLWWWQPFQEINSDGASPRYALMSTDEQFRLFSKSHWPAWVFLALFFVLVFVMLPIIAFRKIHRNLNRKMLTKQASCKQLGFMYHGLELKYPEVMYEAVLMTLRFAVGVIAEGVIPDTHTTLSVYRILAVLQFVTHITILPYEKVGGSKLNVMMGASILMWLLTSQILLMQPRIYDHEDDSEYSTTLIVLSVVMWLFWISMAYTAFREISRLVYMNVEMPRKPDEVAFFPGNIFHAINMRTHVPFHCGLGVLFRCMHSYHERIRRRSLIFMVLCRSADRIDPATRTTRVMTTTELLLSEPEFVTLARSLREDLRDKLNSFIMGCLGLSAKTLRRDKYHQRSNTVTDVPQELHLDSEIDAQEAMQAMVDARIPPSDKNMKKGVEDSGRVSVMSAVEKKTLQESGKRLQRHYNNSDREALARLLAEALDIMVSNHGLTNVPYCLVEYIFADCCFMLCQTRGSEMHNRQKVFDFIFHHPVGKEEGITEIFIANKGAPSLTTGKRSDRLKALRLAAHLFNSGHKVGAEAAAEFMLNEDTSEKFLALVRNGLTIQDLERYVTNLKCQDAAHTAAAIQGFAEQAAQMKFKAAHGGEPTQKACQTACDQDMSVQTEHIVSAAVNTDVAQLHKMQGEVEEARRSKENALEELLAPPARMTEEEEEEAEWRIDSALRKRVESWIIDNSRLQAISSGLGLRKMPIMSEKDGLACAPWGVILEGIAIDQDWIEITTTRGARFLPRHVEGKVVVRPYDSKLSHDAQREEAEAAKREAEILEEEILKVLSDS